jgi:hypothetical protein
MKISNDTIGNRTGDLPTSSAVPQPTAPPRAPWTAGTIIHKTHTLIHMVSYAYFYFQFLFLFYKTGVFYLKSNSSSST